VAFPGEKFGEEAIYPSLRVRTRASRRNSLGVYLTRGAELDRSIVHFFHAGCPDSLVSETHRDFRSPARRLKNGRASNRQPGYDLIAKGETEGQETFLPMHGVIESRGMKRSMEGQLRTAAIIVA